MIQRVISERVKCCRQYLACILLLVSSFSATASDEMVLTLATTDSLSGVYHSQEQTGLIDELLEEALQRMGYRLRVLTVPAARSLKMAEEGLVDGDLVRTTAIEAHFPTLLRVPEVLVDSTFVVFSREPVDLKNAWQSLSGKSVGVILGMKRIENNVPVSALTTKVKDQKQLFKLLLRKRIDYAIFIKEIGLHYLQKNNIRGVILNRMPLDSISAYVYLHSKHAALVPRLASVLREMKKDGSYDALVERHLQVKGNGGSERGAEPKIEDR